MMWVRIVNELFLLLLLSFIFFYWIILTDLYIQLYSITFLNILFLCFAVPKKRIKKCKILKKKILNKKSKFKQWDARDIHFDDYFNSLPKWKDETTDY